jgi:hypothetical protein
VSVALRSLVPPVLQQSAPTPGTWIVSTSGFWTQAVALPAANERVKVLVVPHALARL